MMNALPTGTILENRYRILRLLGEGGMSRVYLAENIRLKVRVAVKENLQASLEAQTQFEREAQILARLSHPNLPRVTDHFVDTQTGRQYLVMDYIEGEDLEAMIKRVGPLPEATALAWIRQILDALEYLHRQQPPIIHRDVKPGNIKITPEGKAVLVDFGIAKVYDPRQATLTGARAVTPGYAPPEQYSLHTTERSDIYALGATLYTMLTGRVPPEAPLRMSSEETLMPPNRIVPGKVSPPTEQAILRAMDVETGKRWSNVAQLRAALEGRGVVSPPQPSEGVVKRRPAVPPIAFGMAMLVVAVAIGLVLIGGLVLLNRMNKGPYPGGVTPTSMPIPTPTIGRVSTRTPTVTSIPTATRASATATSIPTATTRPSPTATPTPPLAERERELLNRTRTRKNGEAIFAYKIPSPPNINGDVGDWSGRIYPIPYFVPDEGGNLISPQNANDLSASFRIAWDDVYLYLVVEVTDNIHVQTQQGEKIFQGDSIELHFDTNLYDDFDKDSDPYDALADDFQIGLSPGDFRGIPPEAYIWEPKSWMKENKGGNIRVAARKTSYGYVLEAAIPWRSLNNIRPNNELIMGFSFNANDNDTPGSAKQETMISQSPVHKWGKPTTYGTLILVDWR